MGYLAHKGDGVLVSKQEISERAEIPSHFLAKIVQQLSKDRLVVIKQGPKGGDSLPMPPEEVSLLQIIEVMIGGISLNECVDRPSSCSVSKSCSVHKVWSKASRQLREALAEDSLAELSSDESCIPVFPVEVSNV